MLSDGVGGVGLALGSSLLELCECSVSGLGLVLGAGVVRMGWGAWWWPPAVRRVVGGPLGLGGGWEGTQPGQGAGAVGAGATG